DPDNGNFFFRAVLARGRRIKGEAISPGGSPMASTPPDMQSIFGRALEIESTTDRAAYLDKACGPDAGLRAEIEGLLATLGRAGEFMRRPAAAAVEGGAARDAPLAAGAGAPVGAIQPVECTR